MGLVAAALAGYGVAVLAGWAAARLEKWWAPKWRTTLWAFGAARATPPLAACAAGAARLASEASLVAVAASATLAWLIAQSYVLLLLAGRR